MDRVIEQMRLRNVDPVEEAAVACDEEQSDSQGGSSSHPLADSFIEPTACDENLADSSTDTCDSSATDSCNEGNEQQVAPVDDNDNIASTEHSAGQDLSLIHI